MKTTLTHPTSMSQTRSAFIQFAIVLILLIGVTVYATPPTTQDDASIVGAWRVKVTNRRYDISAGRNLKISGTGFPVKYGVLVPQEDGSYLVHLEGQDQVLRLVFTQAKDQLSIECFTKKNLKLGLPPQWKVAGVRM